MFMQLENELCLCKAIWVLRVNIVSAIFHIVVIDWLNLEMQDIILTLIRFCRVRVVPKQITLGHGRLMAKRKEIWNCFFFFQMTV